MSGKAVSSSIKLRTSMPVAVEPDEILFMEDLNKYDFPPSTSKLI